MFWAPERAMTFNQAFGPCTSRGRVVRGDTSWCSLWLGQSSMF